MSHVGVLIKTKRKKLGLSQGFIGNKLNYHPQFVSDWERGRSHPPKKVFKKLMKALYINKWDFYNELVMDYEDSVKRYLGL